MAKTMKQFHALPKFGSKRCLVYLYFSWLSSVSFQFEKQIECAVKQCFFAVKKCVAYFTNKLLSAISKVVLSALQKSNVIYRFSCHCDIHYVGCAFLRLQDRIKQHVSKSIRCFSSSRKRLLPARRCKSFTQINTLLLIQPLNFIFYKILSVVNIMMIVDSLFLPKATFLSIYLLLKPLFF